MRSAAVVRTPARGEITTVRETLIAATRETHEKLHHHPMLARLMADNLRLSEYETILSKYADIYFAAEKLRQRRGCYDAFNLRADTETLARYYDPATTRPDFGITNDLEILACFTYCMAPVLVPNKCTTSSAKPCHFTSTVSSEDDLIG